MHKFAIALAALTAATSLAGAASATPLTKPGHAQRADRAEHAQHPNTPRTSPQVAWGKIERVNTQRRAFEVNDHWYRYGARQASMLQPGKTVRFNWRRADGHRVAYRIAPYSG